MDCGFFIYSPEKEIKTGYKLFGQKSPMLISAHIKCIHIYRLILWAAPNDDVMWPIRNGALIKYENIKSRKGVENSSTFVFEMQVKRPLNKKIRWNIQKYEQLCCVLVFFCAETSLFSHSIEILRIIEIWRKFVAHQENNNKRNP